jgi:hypothetical protein
MPSMKRQTTILIALVLLLIACGAWAVDGVRWVATRRPHVVPAG